jgi:ABC-type nickel/cobalt efflux system permease component RcnA
MAKIVEWQTAFNRDLTASLKSLKEGGAFWWLGGVSFLYGIVHAAGPGHGKVVISSYLLANEARLRRGVTIAFISAFAQAVVAVALIGAMAVVLNMTSMAITSTARAFEAGSFALVALLGFYLVFTKGRAAIAAARGGDPHAHHHHGHDHGHRHEHHHHHDHDHHPHDHAHVCVAHAAARTGSDLGSAAAAVFSVGLRPCSGALVILVFALSQGVFWAGVASTFVMALGTAITVAALATLAVGAKGVARRLAQSDDRRAGQVMLGLELAAAMVIAVMGTALFLGVLLA